MHERGSREFWFTFIGLVLFASILSSFNSVDNGLAFQRYLESSSPTARVVDMAGFVESEGGEFGVVEEYVEEPYYEEPYYEEPYAEPYYEEPLPPVVEEDQQYNEFEYILNNPPYVPYWANDFVRALEAPASFTSSSQDFLNYLTSQGGVPQSSQDSNFMQLLGASLY